MVKKKNADKSADDVGPPVKPPEPAKSVARGDRSKAHGKPAKATAADKPASDKAAASDKPTRAAKVVGAAKTGAHPSPRLLPVRPVEEVAEPTPEPVRPRKRVFKKSEMEQFRELLLRKRSRLSGDLNLMHGEALRATDDDVSTDHMADYGSDRYEQDFTLGLIENEEEIVRHIDEALDRIESGEYGICVQCGNEIGVPRLQAIPHVRFCIECQRSSEAG